MRTCGARRSGSENTATERIPISRQARITRTAISPRLAIRILRNLVIPFLSVARRCAALTRIARGLEATLPWWKRDHLHLARLVLAADLVATTAERIGYVARNLVLQKQLGRLPLGVNARHADRRLGVRLEVDDARDGLQRAADDARVARRA